MAKRRRPLDGTGPFSGFAVACWIIGLGGLLSVGLSNDGMDWWLSAHTVRGHEAQGLVYYSVGATRYTVDDPKGDVSSAPRDRTVYYLPDHPDTARLTNTLTEVLDWGVTAGPGVVGAGLLMIGFVKRAERSRRTRDRAPDTYGRGIPSETIQSILAREKGSPR